METDKIRSTILELLSEDDYGSWELWWKIRSETPEFEEDVRRRRFVDVMENLINAGKLKAKSKKGASRFEIAKFTRLRLEREVDQADQPDPDRFYWFGVA